MKRYLSSTHAFVSTLTVLVVLTTSLRANVTISDEDFETGATGWSNNLTESEAAFSRHLGRFGNSGGNQSVFKTFALPGGQTEILVSFDFYEIDSWDSNRQGGGNEVFNVYVNDVLVASNMFDHFIDDADPVQRAGQGLPTLAPAASTSGVAISDSNIVNLSGTNRSLGYSNFEDQQYRFTFTVADALASANFKLGFGANLQESTLDEAWGIDNVRIAVNAVPEPSSALLVLLTPMAFLRRSREAA